ncbi:MAG: hypothetical protein JSU63_15020 [Phycisphaerales bacterium]|nr:MAG: hypothetical protein JSU63_15020 [Phycisphaerales bacterium]
MFTGVRISGRHTPVAAIVAWLAVGGYAAVAQLQDGARPYRERPWPKCGRAWSAANRLRAELSTPPDPSYLQALADTDVLHYALQIEVSDLDPLGSTCWLAGSNTMTIQSKSAALSEFSFRLGDYYEVNGAFVNGSTPVAVNNATETTWGVTLDRTYALDETFTLTIEYSGYTVHLPEVWGSITVRTQDDGTPVVATLSQPYFAYSWWPVKEGDVGTPGDHSDKATLEFSIIAPDTFAVPSNGVLQGVDVLPGNRKRHRWASAYPIIPSLVAFAATEYNTWTLDYVHPGGTMPVEFYIYPELDIPENRAGWELCLDMIEIYAALFGEYPFIEEKYGIYNFPWAGLEHQTMTGQGPEEHNDPFNEYLTSHELAHQWWGDAVTCKTWNHIWLNEGFATYADVMWEEFKPGGGPEVLKDLMAYRRDFVRWDDGSVYVPDEELSVVEEIFNSATSYCKGAWVLHMLRHMFGDETFFDILRAYRTAYEFKAATTEDFQAVCEDFNNGESLEWFFEQWIYGLGTPSFDWGWDSVGINGQYYLLLSIDQVQSDSFPQFIAPIDFSINDSTIHTVFNDSDFQNFVVPVSSAPSSVEFDPDVWLLWGAVTETGYVPGPPTIVETSPAPGEVIVPPEFIEVVTITFHSDVDLNERDISLVGAKTGAVSFSLTSLTGVNPVVLELSEPLPFDVYTLTITDDVTGSATGLALDGEIDDPRNPRSLPSGDGVPGGHAVIEFGDVGVPIPAVSDWALAVMTLLILAVGSLLVVRQLHLR